MARFPFEPSEGAAGVFDRVLYSLFVPALDAFRTYATVLAMTDKQRERAVKLLNVLTFLDTQTQQKPKHLRGFGRSMYRGLTGAGIWTRLNQCAYNLKKFLQLYRNEALEESMLIALRL